MRTFPQVPPEFKNKKFSPTGIETYLACPRKYYYQKILNLIPSGSQIDFEFGSCMHEAIGTYYKTRGHLGQLEAVKQALLVFKNSWEELRIEGTIKKNSKSGLLLLFHYFETYKDDGLHFLPEYIECPQWIQMPNGTILSGIIDRVRKEDDYVCVVDTKTTGLTISDWFWNGLQNSFQLASYDYMVSCILGHCDGIQIDAMSVPFKDDKSFGRRSWQLTTMQKEDWLNTYVKVTNTLLGCNPDNPLDYPCFGCSCGDFGGCKYISLCKYGLKHPSLNIDFIKQERKEVEV